MFVADYMRKDLVLVKDDARLTDAHDLMQRHGIHQLPVIDDAERLLGIVTDRDIRSSLGYCEIMGENLLRNYDATLRENMTVSEIMTHDPKTISMDRTLDEALAMLCETPFNALPVMDGRRLAGIITKADLLRAFHHVLGLDKQGERVEVALPEMWRNVKDAAAAMEHCNGEIISAVVGSVRRDGDEPFLYMRVGGVPARKIEEALRRAGLVVLVPEHR